MSINIAVIGGGRLAQVVSQVLSAGSSTVKLWARRPEVRQKLNGQLRKVKIVDTLAEACTDARVIMLAVPADAMPAAAEQIGPFARGDQVVIHASRGVARDCLLPHQAIRAETCIRKIVALGGPLYADKIAPDQPMVAVVASRFLDAIEGVKRVTAGTPVKLHAVQDVTGVEMAGAVSNVSALAVGMCQALNLGETARGVLLTRGLSEATRMGVKLGAELSTFSGLAGVGDLIPRSVSSTTRHHEVGAKLAEGKSLDEALAGIQGCVEGVTTARELAALSDKMRIKLPLVQSVAGILAGRLQVKPALDELLRMDLELERESISAR